MRFQSFKYLVVRIGNGIFSLLTMVILTRLLSPEEYGLYAIYITVSSLISVIFYQWIIEAFSRYYPKQRDQTGKVMIVALRGFWFSTAFGTLIFFVLLLFYKSIEVSPLLLVTLYLISIMLGYHSLTLQVANVKINPIFYGILSWTKNGCALFASLFFIFLGYTEMGPLFGYLTGLLLAVIIFNIKNSIDLKADSDQKVLFIEMFQYGFPLTINFAAILIVDVADRYLIGKLLGIAFVAPYAVAYDLVQQTVGPIMNILFLGAFPLIVKVFESKGEGSTKMYLQVLGERLVAIGLPVAVGVAVLSSEIADIVLGKTYNQNASEIIPWLSASIFVATLKTYFFDIAFKLKNKLKKQRYIDSMMAVINILFNLILLPKFGVVAAAWATLIAFSFGALASWIIGKSELSLPPLINIIWRGSCSCLCMGIFLYLLPESRGATWLLAKIILGAIIYGIMSCVFDVAGFRGLIKKWQPYQ